MVPHSIITVSLATAILPRLAARAADGDLAGDVALAVVDHAQRARPGHPVRRAAAGGRHRRRPPALGLRRRPATTTTLFAPAARALRHRARLLHRPLPGAARLLRPRAQRPGVLDPVRRGGRQHRRGASSSCAEPTTAGTASALVLAYAAAYFVGATLSFALLARRVGRPRRRRPAAVPAPPGDRDRPWPSPRPAARRTSCTSWSAGRAGWAAAATLVVAGLAGGLVLVGTARVVRLTELTSIVDTIARRLPLPRRH